MHKFDYENQRFSVSLTGLTSFVLILFWSPMIIELKWNNDADTAIRQIKERRYAGALKGFGSEVLLVGISYDKDSVDKKHSCIIETIQL